MSTSAPARNQTQARIEEQLLSTVDTSASRALALRAAEAAGDKKASDIRLLEVGDLLGITDFFLLCSAGNDRQLRTVVEEVAYQLKQEQARVPARREGAPETGWMVLDYGDVVVHAFTDEQRRFYDLERLWADAPSETFDELAAVQGERGGASG